MMKKAWCLARPGNSPPCTKIDEREELRRDNANKKEREKKKGVGKVPESMGMFEKRGRCGERERRPPISKVVLSSFFPRPHQLWWRFFLPCRERAASSLPSIRRATWNAVAAIPLGSSSLASSHCLSSRSEPKINFENMGHAPYVKCVRGRNPDRDERESEEEDGRSVQSRERAPGANCPELS